ncbi:60s ribosomal protein [Pseudoloma neurophilia]|uniref:60s ribosomal protein n=1 Tax=Pseudoloma neurophilia TaxID=146866 RepID=A0A0R0LRY2_9MICR|nr:60s ribosomal protein [Pseudoloma neurophilia]
MGKIIRKVREQNKKLFKSIYKREKVLLPNVKENCEGVIESIEHERGRGAPIALCKIQLKDRVIKNYIVAPEGISIGQKIQFGKSVEPKIGNCVHLRDIPEGSYISMVEKKAYDGGKYAKSCGTSALIVFHNRDAHLTTLKLPSGERVTVSNEARAFIGIISGGGKDDRPLLKAGTAYHKYKTLGRVWPKVRGVAMNPVDHPHGGGNHQHIGHPSTVSKNAPPNVRVGLVGARQTGRKKGSRNEFN